VQIGDQMNMFAVYNLDSNRRMNFGQLYHVEMEINERSPGNANGTVQLWLNGALLLSRVGNTITQGSTETLLPTNYDIGRQGNRNCCASGDIDEYLHWDNFAVSINFLP
jgi:hypothetical protein